MIHNEEMVALQQEMVVVEKNKGNSVEFEEKP